MVRIRFTRMGRKHLPHYRIVVTPNREKRDSKPIEFLGTYSPLSKLMEIKKDRVEYWLSVGAQPSKTVKNLLVKNKIIKADTTKKVYAKKAGKKKTERVAAEASN